MLHLLHISNAVICSVLLRHVETAAGWQSPIWYHLIGSMPTLRPCIRKSIHQIRSFWEFGSKSLWTDSVFICFYDFFLTVLWSYAFGRSWHVKLCFVQVWCWKWDGPSLNWSLLTAGCWSQVPGKARRSSSPWSRLRVQSWHEVLRLRNGWRLGFHDSSCY